MKANIRARLMQNGKAAITTTSPDVVLTNVSRVNTMKIENGSGPAPLLTTVRLPFSNPNRKCWSYRVDWGDGSPNEKLERSGTDTECSSYRYSPSEEILQHQYTKAGSFTITSKSNQLGNTPIDKIIPVEQEIITVQ